MAYNNNTPLTVGVATTQTATVVTGQAGYIVMPFRGRIIQAGSVLGAATTTADSTVTVSIAGTAVTGGAWVITQSGSAAGDHDYAATNDSSANAVISGANTFNKNDLIKFALTGTGTAGAPLSLYLHYQKLG
jgi:hypothetical protein